MTGIGATPCLSILAEIISSKSKSTRDLPEQLLIEDTQKVVLVWASRENVLFSEFQALLRVASRTLGKDSIRLFCIGGKNGDVTTIESGDAALSVSYERPDMTAILDEAVGLCQGELFDSVGGRYKGNRRVAVFACGPEKLLDAVSVASRKHPDAVHVHKEAFVF